jgi:hypothetical protein
VAASTRLNAPSTGNGTQSRVSASALAAYGIFARKPKESSTLKNANVKFNFLTAFLSSFFLFYFLILHISTIENMKDNIESVGFRFIN